MKHGYVIGVELNDKICQISYYDEAKKEPQTQEVNADNYQIPLVIGRRNDSWVYGREAQRTDITASGNSVSDLLSLAAHRGLVEIEGRKYEGIWLLSMYIRLVLKKFQEIEAIAFTIPEVDVDVVQLLKSVGQKIGVPRANVYVQDYKESFCYYMFYQPKELWQYEAALFHCDRNEVKAYMLRKLRTGSGKGRDTFVTVDEVASEHLEELENVYPVLNVDKAKEADESFRKFIQNVFEKKLISSVFLIGEGFENSWYPNSLRTLCNGRRAFQGNNLYSKGACYTAYNRITDHPEGPVYLDETRTTDQICLKLRVNSLDEWHPIVPWGTRWYEGDRQFELLLEDAEQIEIHVESLLTREMKVIEVPLDGLPDRRDYTLRLQVNAIFLDEKTCRITWKDIGFGAFFEPSGFRTETVIHLGGSDGQFNSLPQ